MITKASISVKVNQTLIKARNVIGMIKGTDSTQSIMIGGHYDYLVQRGESIYFGADDNASGASDVIALAQKWIESGIKLAQLCNIFTNNTFNLDIWDVNKHSRSDYAGFVAENIPVMTFFSGFHNDYHSPRDTKERLDLKKMESVLRLVNACIQHIMK